MNSYQVGVAAEAFAAAALARAGCNISVQYGANQPEYDLMASKGDKVLKVSVKGSQDGSWIAASSWKNKNGTYAEALKHWEKDHNKKTVLVFVQFKGIEFDVMPRMYMASVREVAEFLSKTRGGHINLILYEHHKYVRGVGVGHEDTIPEEWILSEKRVGEMLQMFG